MRKFLGLAGIGSVFISMLFFTFSSLSATFNSSKKIPAPKSPYTQIQLDTTRTTSLKGVVYGTTVDKVLADFRAFEKADSTKPIYFIINSPGGSVPDGNRVILAMKALKSPVVCIIDEMAYSMGSGIAMQCPKLYATEYSDAMFHEVQYRVGGFESQVNSRVKHAQDICHELHAANAARLNLKYSDYRARIVSELWLTPLQLYGMGALDGILTSFDYEYPNVEPDAEQLERLRLQRQSQPWWEN